MAIKGLDQAIENLSRFVKTPVPVRFSNDD